MVQYPEPFDDEDTDVALRRVRQGNRKMQLTIAAVVVVVAALGTWWVSSSQQSEDGRFGGSPDAMHDAIRKERKSWIVHPDSPTARVNIELSQPGKLWIEDEDHGQIESTTTVELPPGEHTLRAVFGLTELRQLITTHEGQEFRIYFDRQGKDIVVHRVPGTGSGQPTTVPQ